MSQRLSVLQVEDSPSDGKLVLRELERTVGAARTHRVEDAAGLRAALDAGGWDLILSDWSLPGFGALEALEIVRAQGLDIPFIIVSGTVGEESAVAAMRAGARDYVLKDKLARLGPVVERELKESRTRAALRRSEEQLRQSQKLEAIGSLAGGIAHDFNNLLSVILSYTGLLLTPLEADHPMRADLAEILAAGERASTLTRQLLAFSRKQILQPRVVSLNAVVTGIETMLRRLIGENIDFTVRLAPELRLARVDPGQIEQVVMNLVVNARDAMPNGGQLTVETSNVDLDEAYAAAHPQITAGPHVMLAVTDTGTGMSPETQARIFEPFFTTKDKSKGTGLGLSTVFGIVNQSDGDIWVYSELGKGTAFKIHLPVVTDAATSVSVASAEPAVAARRGSETVLLVEDDDQVRRTVSAVLRLAGYRIIEAASPAAALLIAEQDPSQIDLLLTDVVMPGMTGGQLAERLRPLRPRTRVLYMSGYTDGSIVHHGVLDPGIAFIQKPITVEALTLKVREVLDSKP